MGKAQLTERKQERRFQVFLLIAILLVAQVGWWTTLFVRNVNELESLRIANYTLSEKQGLSVGPAPSEISKEAYHKRIMFVSESVFFLLLTGFGLYLLFRALKYDQKAHETQKNFIQILAHESKTPLTALKLRLESLLETQNDPYTRKEMTSGIEDIRRLSSIVEKSLNLNRLEREEMVKELVCVADVIRDLVRRLEPFFKDRNVEISLSLKTESCTKGDRDGLRNSFQSLIENAVHYNEKEKKTLHIELTEKNGRIAAHFADNGPGIAKGEEELVFEKFYRGKSRSRVSGTGLGLYIAKFVIEAHQGLIRLIPSSKGAHFEINLPVST